MASELDETEQKFKNAITSTIKAISGNNDIDVTFQGENAFIFGNKVVLPEINEANEQSIRGFADSIAMRIKHHDSDIYNKNKPQHPISKLIFDNLEILRYENIGSEEFIGAKENIKIKTLNAYKDIQNQNKIPIEFALPIILQSELSNTKDFNGLADACKADYKVPDALINELIKHISSQDKYSLSINKLLDSFNLPHANSDVNEDDNDGDENDPDDEDNQSEQANQSQENNMMQGGEDDDGQQSLSTEMEAAGLNDDGDEELDSNGDSPNSQKSNLDPNGFDAGNYHIYTDEFDEIVKASDLCPPLELSELRQNLDSQITGMQKIVTKLANKLQRQLMAQQQRRWQFDLEEGLLDSAKLARIIIDPDQPLSYKQESKMEFKDTVVSLLIDNSGSMRGRPISIAAISTDILARVLERCSIKTEILGFTTKTWKGGTSREKWISYGKAKNPGRLNDLRHIIYKSADSPWRHSHKNLGLMLKEGILKENIDGESLLWAHKRLKSRYEQRKILMVISDGAPVDDSTLSSNPQDFLEDHLVKVIKFIENKSNIELFAIGIGHDVTKYYTNSVTIRDAESLGDALIDNLTKLFLDKKQDRTRKTKK